MIGLAEAVILFVGNGAYGFEGFCRFALFGLSPSIGLTANMQLISQFDGTAAIFRN